ncbi:MAG: hypothetical protein FWG65_01295 [Turicibacter sp.]|nr:hypothetical protein [Turicibacter sp.]
MLKTEFLANRSYMDKFIEANKEILEHIYVIKIADDEWFAWAIFKDGRGYDFNIDVLPPLSVDWHIDWSFNPVDGGKALAELMAMKECGFLEFEDN